MADFPFVVFARDFSFGLVFSLLSIPAIAVIAYPAKFGRGFPMIFGMELAVEYLVVLGLIQSAPQAIFQTAIYQYLQNNRVSEDFGSGFSYSSTISSSTERKNP